MKHIDKRTYNPLKLLVIYLLIVWPVLAFSLYMIYTGQVTLSYSGFAVDSTGRIYIGKDGRIDVYENNQIISSISPMTSRGYAFTILQDDTIFLSTASTVYTMDLNGNIINKRKDTGTSTFNSLQHRNVFITANGDKYISKFNWGRTKILKYENSEVHTVFIMPVFDYVIKILLILYAISMVIFVPLIIKKWRKK